MAQIVYALCIEFNVFNICGLVTAYCVIDLGQHKLKQWLVAWRHQAITCTNTDISSIGSCDVHLREGLVIRRSEDNSQQKKIGNCVLKIQSIYPRSKMLTISIAEWFSHSAALHLTTFLSDTGITYIHSWEFIANGNDTSHYGCYSNAPS